MEGADRPMLDTDALTMWLLPELYIQVPRPRPRAARGPIGSGALERVGISVGADGADAGSGLAAWPRS